MTSYFLKAGGAALLLLAAGMFGIVIFGNIWARVGIGAAIVVVVGGLLFWAWRVDRKAQEARADLPPI
jgi:Flp pilus assembly protein TadB